jgi:hypothetical protein
VALCPTVMDLPWIVNTHTAVLSDGQAADVLQQHGIYEESCFHAQQAAEDHDGGTLYYQRASHQPVRSLLLPAVQALWILTPPSTAQVWPVT